MPSPLLIGLLAMLTALPGCAPQAGVVPAAPARTRVPDAPDAATAPEDDHPLAHDFRALGEALAKFWRGHERFPADLAELQAFAGEHELDLRLTQLTDLSLGSKLYGQVLTGQCGFPYPGPGNAPVRGSATFEVDATDPEGTLVSFDAGTPDGQAYLEEAFRIFHERFESRAQ